MSPPLELSRHAQRMLEQHLCTAIKCFSRRKRFVPWEIRGDIRRDATASFLGLVWIERIGSNPRSSAGGVSAGELQRMIEDGTADWERFRQSGLKALLSRAFKEVSAFYFPSRTPNDEVTEAFQAAVIDAQRRAEGHDDRKMDLMDAVNKLPRKYKEAALEKRDGLTLEEGAAKHGVPSSTYQGWRDKAYYRLSQLLKDHREGGY